MRYAFARAKAQVLGHDMGQVAIGVFQQVVKHGGRPFAVVPIISKGETVEVVVFFEQDTQPAPGVLSSGGS